uniref:MADF domain-containing protein n=1 Tax=Glossina brevipalpis TaxID=37001 RepID=A0A1A9WKC0_9MUSC
MSNDHYGCLSDSAMAALNSSSNSCISTRWLTEEVFALIDLVQRNEAIYNPRHKYYFCRPYVENFWREVDLKLEKNLGASLAKWTNLRISFRREYTNYLEEKVPPCWTYFDRMFFLHPYLRKKHQQSKSLDSHVQDTLVQISTLSDRLQRERAAAAASLSNDSATGDQNVNSPPSNVPSNQVDSYLEYLDEAEPNASELDDMTDDEPINHVRSYAHDIKSECEDNVDDFDPDSRQHIDDEHEGENDDHDMRNFVLHTMGKSYQQQRLQHLQRLQTRSFYEDFRNKRAKSNDIATSSQLTSVHNATSTPLSSNVASNHTTNVSFVRPTFSKASENINTSAQNLSNLSNNTNSNASNELESVTNSTSTRPSGVHYHSFGHSPHNNQYQHHHHHSRFEMAGISNTSSGTGNTTGSNANLSVTPELCDCKTDPDAMFLMSLLPDIQKLNGRDRGKIKIAFQNILQDYLYPD